MIIDADTHISPLTEANAIPVEQLLARMDRCGVFKAVTWIKPPYMRDLDESLAYLHEAASQYPQRIVPFGWADPLLGKAKAIDTVKRCVEEYGFRGVKMHGGLDTYRIDDPEVSLPVIEAVAATGKALALHSAADSYEETHPFRVGKIARMFPEMPILMVHMGGVGWADLSVAAIEVARECPNVTLIGSAVRAVRILQAIKALGAGRVCFGSDTPFGMMHVELAKYRALMDQEVAEPDQQAVLGGNIARVLGL